jgi:FemAB-related protein (PEP-CTERM system-associated)
MWEALDRKVRNQIRKARKSELVSECGGAELLDDFYDVFSRNMRDLGTPVYSRALFAEILAAFPHRASLHIVRLGTRAVAAGISFITRSTLEVPSASSLREHNHLCPNHLLYWSIIEHAIAQGCDTLDFGRSTPGEGPYKFKEQWGATPLPLNWEYQLVGAAAVPNTSPSNPKFKYAIELWKHCPLWLANTLGPHITRAVP